jgi:hypothetical protein
MTMNSFADREWIQCWSNIWAILFTGTASLSNSQRCGAHGHCQSLSNQLLLNGWNVLKRHTDICVLQTPKRHFQIFFSERQYTDTLCGPSHGTLGQWYSNTNGTYLPIPWGRVWKLCCSINMLQNKDHIPFTWRYHSLCTCLWNTSDLINTTGMSELRTVLVNM